MPIGDTAEVEESPVGDRCDFFVGLRLLEPGLLLELGILPGTVLTM